MLDRSAEVLKTKIKQGVGECGNTDFKYSLGNQEGSPPEHEMWKNPKAARGQAVWTSRKQTSDRGETPNRDPQLTSHSTHLRIREVTTCEWSRGKEKDN
jgi:hypothetical protein